MNPQRSIHRLEIRAPQVGSSRRINNWSFGGGGRVVWSIFSDPLENARQVITDDFDPVLSVSVMCRLEFFNETGSPRATVKLRNYMKKTNGC